MRRVDVQTYGQSLYHPPGLLVLLVLMPDVTDCRSHYQIFQDFAIIIIDRTDSCTWFNHRNFRSVNDNIKTPEDAVALHDTKNTVITLWRIRSLGCVWMDWKYVIRHSLYIRLNIFSFRKYTCMTILCGLSRGVFGCYIIGDPASFFMVKCALCKISGINYVYTVNVSGAYMLRSN